jgi:hypothetical protein
MSVGTPARCPLSTSAFFTQSEEWLAISLDCEVECESVSLIPSP